MSEPIPFLGLAAQNAPLLPRVREGFERVFAANVFGAGDEVEALERDVASALGVAHALGISNGSDGIVAALSALGVSRGDEVVTSPLGSLATAGAIARLGAKPVFVDIDPATYHLDLAQIPPAVSERTRAILPVHLYGQPCDMSILRELAGAFSIPILEDGMHAIGASTEQGRVGTLGAVGCFSFHPPTSFSAFGDAALLTTDDGDLAERMRRLLASGGSRTELLGAPMGMDALQAVVLRVKLPHLGAWTDARRANASLYDLLFMESGLSPDYIRPPKRLSPGHVYDQYVVRVSRAADRDELRAYLTEHGVGTDLEGLAPLHLHPCLAALGHAKGAFPEAERAFAESLGLPMYAELQTEQIERVVDTIAAFFEV